MLAEKGRRSVRGRLPIDSDTRWASPPKKLEPPKLHCARTTDGLSPATHAHHVAGGETEQDPGQP